MAWRASARRDILEGDVGVAEVVFLLQGLDDAVVDFAADHADGMVAQFGDAGDRRSRRRHDHHHAMRGQRDGAGLLQIADVGPHHREIGVAGIEGLGRIEHAAGILDLEPDPAHRWWQGGRRSARRPAWPRRRAIRPRWSASSAACIAGTRSVPRRRECKTRPPAGWREPRTARHICRFFMNTRRSNRFCGQMCQISVSLRSPFCKRCERVGRIRKRPVPAALHDI